MHLCKNFVLVLKMSEFRQKLIGYVISELRRKNVYSAGKTSGFLRGGVSCLGSLIGAVCWPAVPPTHIL